MHQTQKIPASGPRLTEALTQAQEHLDVLARKNNYDHDGWPDHARLWRSLLEQSKSRMGPDRLAPHILKGDLASPVGVRLSGRYWTFFIKWFERVVVPGLNEQSLQSGIPVLVPVRVSNRNGGYPESSESIYFLAFASKGKSSSDAADESKCTSDTAGRMDIGKETSHAEHTGSLEDSVDKYAVCICIFPPSFARELIMMIGGIFGLVLGSYFQSFEIRYFIAIACSLVFLYSIWKIWHSGILMAFEKSNDAQSDDSRV